jgi:hypothetical protein
MGNLKVEIAAFTRELREAVRPALEADEAWRRRVEEHLKSLERRVKRIETGYGIGD